MTVISPTPLHVWVHTCAERLFAGFFHAKYEGTSSSSKSNAEQICNHCDKTCHSCQSLEEESGVSLSKLKKPVATISQHVQLKVASLDLEKHMGDQHVELHIHWQCSKLDVIEETWASGKGSQSDTEKNGQDPEYAVSDAHSLVSQDSQLRIKHNWYAVKEKLW
jgi:hypothetical protein